MARVRGPGSERVPSSRAGSIRRNSRRHSSYRTWRTSFQ